LQQHLELSSSRTIVATLASGPAEVLLFGGAMLAGKGMFDILGRRASKRIEGQVCQFAIYKLSRILVVGWRPDSTNLSGAAADVKCIGALATDLTSSKQRFLRILAGYASCAI
jgi:hypothetical protein